VSPRSQTITSIDELFKFAQELTRTFAARQIVDLRGPLGVGKTELARQIVRALGGAGVSSPTFVYHQRYVTPEGEVDHLDLYRIETRDALESIGFWDLFRAETGLVLIEWGELLPDSDWPPGWSRLRVDLSVDPDGSGRR
jgi:tRNA threonylcarbamoyladenosine biosynthesis protein TsaE